MSYPNVRLYSFPQSKSPIVIFIPILLLIILSIINYCIRHISILIRISPNLILSAVKLIILEQAVHHPVTHALHRDTDPLLALVLVKRITLSTLCCISQVGQAVVLILSVWTVRDTVTVSVQADLLTIETDEGAEAFIRSIRTVIEPVT